jgi:hypothetical protein
MATFSSCNRSEPPGALRHRTPRIAFVDVQTSQPDAGRYPVRQRIWGLSNASELPGIDSFIPAHDAATLLRNYGWKLQFGVARHRLSLPATLAHTSGESPVRVYWAYNNELSKAVGLDLTPFLGESVIAEIYVVQEGETLPHYFYPNNEPRMIVIREVRSHKIIGAWADCFGRFGGSLDRQRLEEIAGCTWERWLLRAGIVNPDDSLEQALTAMPAERLVRTYFAAIDRHDYRLARACMTREYATEGLSMNVDDSDLWRPDADEYFSCLTSTKVLWLTEEYGRDVPQGEKMYCATLYGESGLETRNVWLEEEVPGLGWRIAACDVPGEG